MPPFDPPCVRRCKTNALKQKPTPNISKPNMYIVLPILGPWNLKCNNCQYENGRTPPPETRNPKGFGVWFKPLPETRKGFGFGLNHPL